MSETITQAAGKVLAGAFGALGRVRPTAKPLHPRGTVHAARLRRFGASPPMGVQWLDEDGDDEAVVRLSRAVGLPAAVPDILGLAIRAPLGTGRHGDLLLATTGAGPLSRYTLAAARDPYRATYSTLLPYRTPAGPASIAAMPITGDEHGFDLRVALGRGPWITFATLTLGHAQASSDAQPSFDPVTNTLPGLQPYDWVATIREGAYRAARRSRGDSRLQP